MDLDSTETVTLSMTPYNRTCGYDSTCTTKSTYLKCIDRRCQCDSNSHYDLHSRKCLLNKDVKCTIPTGRRKYDFPKPQPCGRYAQCQVHPELKDIKEVTIGFCQCLRDNSRHRHDGKCNAGHSIHAFNLWGSGALSSTTILILGHWLVTLLKFETFF